MQRKRPLFFQLFLTFVLFLPLLWRSVPVCAQETEKGPLIQTTTFAEQYEGMVLYGGTATKVTDREDPEQAFENVRPCMVQIFAGQYYGSGILWEMDREQLLILSNRHLLSGWDQTSYIVFYGGAQAEGELLMLSDTCDLGFVRVRVSDMRYEDLVRLRTARRGADYGQLSDGDAVFHAGSADGAGETVYEGTLADSWRYMEAFDTYMLYSLCGGKPGMSGGGTFDGYGNLIGMLTGGTRSNETASLPLPVLQEEYEKLKKLEEQGGKPHGQA